MAMFLGSAAAAYFIIPPRRTLTIEGPDHQLGFAMYLIVCGALILLAERQRRTSHQERIQRQRFEITLSTIGAAVMTTDANALGDDAQQ